MILSNYVSHWNRYEERRGNIEVLQTEQFPSIENSQRIEQIFVWFMKSENMERNQSFSSIHHHRDYESLYLAKEKRKSRSSRATFLTWLKHLDDIIKQRFPSKKLERKQREFTKTRISSSLPSLSCVHQMDIDCNRILYLLIRFLSIFLSRVMSVRVAMKNFIAEGLTF